MRSRSILGKFAMLVLVWLLLGASPGLAQEREEGGVKEVPVAAAGAVTGLVPEDLTGPLTAQDLVYTLVGQGITVSNVTFTGAEVAAGVFQGGAGIIGFDKGIILGTGNIVNVVGPNTKNNIGVNNEAAGDAQLDALAGYPTHDAAVLEFDFLANTNKIQFRYVFASDEYNEYVGSKYNDVFAFYINGVNCAMIGSDPVSVNTVNSGKNTGSYINNDIASGAPLNTEMDGLTSVLTCNAAVNPTALNHVKLAIADASDFIYDANVFLEQGSFEPVPDCCAGKNCPDDPELSKECVPSAPPFYVVVNREFEDLTRPGTGCQPIILKHPDCKDCCNSQDAACLDAQKDLETRVCPLLASRVDWSQSTGTEIVYEMCCGSPEDCKGKWYYHVRLLKRDGTCPIDPENEACFECLPPGTGIDLPAPLIVAGLAVIGIVLLAAALLVRRRSRKAASA